MTTRRQLQRRPQGKHRPYTVWPGAWQLYRGNITAMPLKMNDFLLGLITREEARDMLERALHAANKPCFFLEAVLA